MCGRSPDNHHAIAIAAPLPPPPSVVVVEMAPHGHRPGKEEAEYNEEEEDDREFEEEFLRFSMMEDEEDDDDDDGEEIIDVVSPPRRPLVGARGTTSAVESVTNLPVATETGGEGTKASKRRRGSAKPPAAKKARSKHGFHGVHRRTYGRWAAEIRDTVIKGTRVWIGTFDTAEAAALAYDAAARRIFGGNARTNFPDDGGDRPPLPPPPSPPAAKPCSSSKSKRPTKKRNTGNGTTTSRRRRRGDQEDAAAAAVPPQAVVAAGNSDDTPAPGASVELISLCTAAAQALELTDGWEFEPFIQELLLGGGVAPLDYFNGQELVGAAAGDLWSF